MVHRSAILIAAMALGVAPALAAPIRWESDLEARAVLERRQPGPVSEAPPLMPAAGALGAGTPLLGSPMKMSPGSLGPAVRRDIQDDAQIFRRNPHDSESHEHEARAVLERREGGPGSEAPPLMPGALGAGTQPLGSPMQMQMKMSPGPLGPAVRRDIQDDAQIFRRNPHDSESHEHEARAVLEQDDAQIFSRNQHEEHHHEHEGHQHQVRADLERRDGTLAPSSRPRRGWGTVRNTVQPTAAFRGNTATSSLSSAVRRDVQDDTQIFSRDLDEGAEILTRNQHEEHDGSPHHEHDSHQHQVRADLERRDGTLAPSSRPRRGWGAVRNTVKPTAAFRGNTATSSLSSAVRRDVQDDTQIFSRDLDESAELFAREFDSPARRSVEVESLLAREIDELD